MSRFKGYNGKPCPFCGCVVVEVRSINLCGFVTYIEYSIECPKCHVSTEWYDYLNDAIAIWESRV